MSHHDTARRRPKRGLADMQSSNVLFSHAPSLVALSQRRLDDRHLFLVPHVNDLVHRTVPTA